MRTYSDITVEKAMTRQEVIVMAYAKKISWIEAAAIFGDGAVGICCGYARSMKKWDSWGRFDGRRGKISPRRTPVETVEEVLRLYRDEYFDFNMRHFHEKLVKKHSIDLSYPWVKNLLQGAGLVAKDRAAASIAPTFYVHPWSRSSSQSVAPFASVFLLYN